MSAAGSSSAAAATVWDWTLAPGAVRRFTVPLVNLGPVAGADDGEDDDEPLNLELVYVFIATEFPRPERTPDEPASTSVLRRRALVAALPACTA